MTAYGLVFSKETSIYLALLHLVLVPVSFMSTFVYSFSMNVSCNVVNLFFFCFSEMKCDIPNPCYMTEAKVQL